MQRIGVSPTGARSRFLNILDDHSRLQDRVDKIGRVTLRYESRLHHIGLGRSPGKRAMILVADLEVRGVTERGAASSFISAPEEGLPAARMR